MTIPNSWKKLTVTVLGTLLIGLGPKVGLNGTQITLIAGLASSYVVGQGIADFKKSRKIIDFITGLKK